MNIEERSALVMEFIFNNVLKKYNGKELIENCGEILIICISALISETTCKSHHRDILNNYVNSIEEYLGIQDEKEK